MLNHIISTSKEFVIEQRKSPLIATFGVFLLILNWRAALILLFADASIEAKINSVEHMFTLQTIVLNPIVCTVLFLGAYPFIAYHIYKYHHYLDKRKQLVDLEHECEVMEAERKRTKLKSRLNDSKYNSEVRIERDKLNHRYQLAERKYALRMKKLEYEAKSREVRKQEKKSHRLPKSQIPVNSIEKRF